MQITNKTLVSQETKYESPQYQFISAPSFAIYYFRLRYFDRFVRLLVSYGPIKKHR